MQTVGCALRRNVTDHDLKIGDAIIPPGYFVAYHLADVHNDESIYPDPAKWDPGRYLPDRAEDKKVWTTLTFVRISTDRYTSRFRMDGLVGA